MARKLKYNPEDYVGKKFGKWTVLEYLGKNRYNIKYMKCRCECGREDKVQLNMLLIGESTKCINCRNKKHGFSRNRLHRIWYEMIDRCYNSNSNEYENYGQCGIVVCDEWKNDYETFKVWALKAGYNKELTIDRINTNGNYEPDNCRWATYKQQILNRNKNKSNKSGYIGIWYTKNMKKWKSDISINYKHTYLGYYDTQKEALEARNKYIIDNGLDYPIQEYKGEIGSLE